MFQFTTTNVINSETDLTSKKAKFGNTDDGNFFVRRVGKFIADNTLGVFKSEGAEGELAKVTIDLSQVSGVEGDTYRLALYVGLSQASQESRYSNDLNYKGKPFTVEFVWQSDTATTVETLVKTINKYELMVYGEKQLTVTYSGTYLTIEAVTEYQRFKQVAIEHFEEDAYHGMGDYTVVRSLSDLGDPVDSNDQVGDSAEGFFPGKEGFGTFSYIMHNLRIPTCPNSDPFGVNRDELPIPGALYNEYVIKYCVKRGVLGTNAVGDMVTSITNHVFYVKNDLATDFEGYLAVLGDITDVPEQ